MDEVGGFEGQRVRGSSEINMKRCEEVSKRYRRG